MKTVGIIGGFGPKTTTEFFMSLLSLWNKRNHNQRPEILISNSPIDANCEHKFITQGMCSEHFLPLLLNASLKLEKAGADFLVLPCNSLHIFIKDIEKSTHIPVLDIREEVLKKLIQLKINKIGLLGNQTVINSNLFNEPFMKNNISIDIPDNSDQIKLNKIIHNLVINNNSATNLVEFMKIVKNYKNNGLKDVLLACTDLQLLKPEFKGVKFIDSLKVLEEATVEKMFEE